MEDDEEVDWARVSATPGSPREADVGEGDVDMWSEEEDKDEVRASGNDVVRAFAAAGAADPAVARKDEDMVDVSEGACGGAWDGGGACGVTEG